MPIPHSACGGTGQDIDLTERAWRIPHTRNGGAQTVPCTPEAIAILHEQQAQAILGAKFVFPGPGKSGHLTEPKTAFASVLKRAGIEDFRIHDLRRTLGGWQARRGASLTIIGKSLGHKSQQQATAIYAPLDLDAATSAMLEAGGLKDSGTRDTVQAKERVARKPWAHNFMTWTSTPGLVNRPSYCGKAGSANSTPAT